ncbi:hypothetical protein HUB98_05895 [Paenibacillus barcinonensis]|uniref:Uncharacterized protein n=1 Tax=Paenibacillus barcinonensis TaxID=198119 RepID=A0A2V4VW55_PAEBA|nr:hypothetical protein [Paenibacillus barcinonensis]PYE51536.1 hypothetical protein DFQ00_102330 [Paenibacillus barcinonensis]QKS55913.1 hypothetical protein HUB98_05895 [Paenibacillus barcinonensis]
MKREDWIVTEYAARPAGKPDRCFYCHSLIGESHTSECVIRSRTVVMDFTVRMVINVPEHWKDEDIEFRYNKGSWCADNLIEMIVRGEGGCLCPHVEATFIREATPEDEEKWGLVRVDDLQS